MLILQAIKEFQAKNLKFILEFMKSPLKFSAAFQVSRKLRSQFERIKINSRNSGTWLRWSVKLFWSSFKCDYKNLFNNFSYSANKYFIVSRMQSWIALSSQHIFVATRCSWGTLCSADLASPSRRRSFVWFWTLWWSRLQRCPRTFLGTAPWNESSPWL